MKNRDKTTGEGLWNQYVEQFENGVATPTIIANASNELIEGDYICSVWHGVMSNCTITGDQRGADFSAVSVEGSLIFSDCVFRDTALPEGAKIEYSEQSGRRAPKLKLWQSLYFIALLTLIFTAMGYLEPKIVALLGWIFQFVN